MDSLPTPCSVGPKPLAAVEPRYFKQFYEGAEMGEEVDPQFARLKQQLDAGVVGKLETLHLVNHDPAAPPPGFIPTSGGLFKDFTVHFTMEVKRFQTQWPPHAKECVAGK